MARLPRRPAAMKSKPKGPRAVALDVLARVDGSEAFADIALDNAAAKARLKPIDRALASEIVFGTLRWRLLIDHYLAQALDRPIEKLERRVLAALRSGAYQILFLDKIPASAAVNETVGLAPPRSRGFVNAVLRSLARQGPRGIEGAAPADGTRPWQQGERKGTEDNGTAPALAGPETIGDLAERLSVTWSHPRWMVENWVGRFGEENAVALMKANNERPSICLRVNPLRTGRDAMLRILRREGVKARPGRYSALAIILDKPRPVQALPGWSEGLISVQDEASQLVPLVLDPRPGESVLDACAAPGTKSLQIMQLMGGKGRVAAVDLHPGRLKRMASEAKRLGMKNITRVSGDASRPFKLSSQEAAEGDAAPVFPARYRELRFDRALVDAPCTGLGTLRRRPEIKWKRTMEDVKARAELQRSILDNVVKYLKPGGVLVYSTCTFTVEENEWAVAPLLHSGEFEQEDPAEVKTIYLETEASFSGLVQNRMLRTWPNITGADGFTVFRLRKKKR